MARRPLSALAGVLHAAGHGARAPAFPSGRLLDLSATPPSPPSSRVPSVPRLADPSPLTELAGVLFAAGHG